MAYTICAQCYGMLRVDHGSEYTIDFPIGYSMLYIPVYTME